MLTPAVRRTRKMLLFATVVRLAIRFHEQMRIWILTALLTASYCMACTVTSTTAVTIFAVEGQVFDKESNRPLENVKVYFIDTGYDDFRSQQPYPAEIGHSDSNGKIRARLNYLWRRNQSWPYVAPKQTVEIVLLRDFYEPVRLNYEGSELPHDGVTFLIDLNKVYLKRRLD
jgi:hypothetical protein